MSKVQFLPKTTTGKWSVGLIIAFFLLVTLGNFIVKIQGPRADQTFLSNPALSISMLSAGISGIASFFAGILSIIRNKERSILVFLSILIGFFILIFILGEILVPH